ncbi:MAG: NADH:ubiquinone reductase (Na(+)-transporting) subunit A, partial [Candidatus Neomarinimicrobiota bacterium]
PLSPNPELVLEGNTRAFQAGLDVLSTLTEGTVHLVRQVETRSEALSQAQHCTTHSVEGPHPAGNVGVLLHHLDPLRPGEVVWTVTLQHVIQLGTFFLTGRLDPTLLVSVAGPGVSAPVHVKTRMGVSLAFLTKDRLHPGEMRFISGDVLTGTARDREEFLGYYDTICSVIPVSHERPFLGWLRLGSPRTKYTLSRAYRGSRRGEFPFTTLQNGDRRAMVPIGAWEKVLPMDIWPNPLYRAIQANDIDEMENLGLLELVEEDVALCSFACPSKIDLGAAVRKGLDVLYQEG